MQYLLELARELKLDMMMEYGTKETWSILMCSSGQWKVEFDDDDEEAFGKFPDKDVASYV